MKKIKELLQPLKQIPIIMKTKHYKFFTFFVLLFILRSFSQC